MTVAELIAALQAFPPDEVVYIDDADTQWPMELLGVRMAEITPTRQVRQHDAAERGDDGPAIGQALVLWTDYATDLHWRPIERGPIDLGEFTLDPALLRLPDDHWRSPITPSPPATGTAYDGRDVGKDKPAADPDHGDAPA